MAVVAVVLAVMVAWWGDAVMGEGRRGGVVVGGGVGGGVMG